MSVSSNKNAADDRMAIVDPSHSIDVIGKIKSLLTPNGIGNGSHRGVTKRVISLSTICCPTNRGAITLPPNHYFAVPNAPAAAPSAPEAAVVPAATAVASTARPAAARAAPASPPVTRTATATSPTSAAA